MLCCLRERIRINDKILCWYFFYSNFTIASSFPLATILLEIVASCNTSHVIYGSQIRLQTLALQNVSNYPSWSRKASLFILTLWGHGERSISLQVNITKNTTAKLGKSFSHDHHFFIYYYCLQYFVRFLC